MGSSRKNRSDRDEGSREKAATEKADRTLKDSKKRIRDDVDCLPKGSMKRSKMICDESESQPGRESEVSQSSLSIADTNKLREKLGLPPLKLEDKPNVLEDANGEDVKQNSYTIDGIEFIHKPATSGLDAKMEEKLREKLDTYKEKRKINEKLNSVKLLSANDEDDSATSWVERSRRLEEEKKRAAERAKILEEMDQDFGVSDLLSQKIKSKHTGAYSSNDLKGMTIQHSMETFGDGSETILVLQDKDVLNASEDVLINPTLVEHEKWAKNADLRKQKPGYDPFQDEFDESGMLRKKVLLGKYDEEIDGEKKESFKLGMRGTIDADDYRSVVSERLHANLKEGYQSLDLVGPQLASEFYTKEEMTKFKKPKRKIKKLKKKGEIGSMLKADDLINSAECPEGNLGSRIRPVVKQEAHSIESDTVVHLAPSQSSQFKEYVDLKSVALFSEDHETEDENLIDDDLTGIVIEDEAEKELQAVLERSRIIKQIDFHNQGASKDAAETVFKNVIKEEPVEEEEDERVVTNSNTGTVVLNSTSEYCRNLGDIPTYGLAGNRDDAEIYVEDKKSVKPARVKREVSSEEEEDEEVDEKPSSSKQNRGGWVNVDRSRSSSPDSDKEQEFDVRPPILEDEPVASGSVAAVLKLAEKKGYLEPRESDDHGPSKLAHLEAKRFTIVDKQFYDIDDKFSKKLERMGAYSGPVSDFKEKPNFNPDVRLVYADKLGIPLNTKEAFRQLSWKFHGKRSGKRKTEKRLIKRAELHLMNEMSSADTPLCTLTKQIDKQKQLSLPYIVLSGAGSKDVGTSIRKE